MYADTYIVHSARWLEFGISERTQLEFREALDDQHEAFRRDLSIRRPLILNPCSNFALVKFLLYTSSIHSKGVT